MELISILRHFIHYGLHFLFPGVVARVFYPSEWKKVWLIFVGAILIDLDHLLATPIFDPSRCSIGFHILHSEYAIVLYIILTLFKKTRVIGIGLLLHIFADTVDCFI